MKNKEFFYLQYDKLKWENQEKTKINSFVNSFIIKNVISKKKQPEIRLFDIGFGIGFFFKMLASELKGKYKQIVLSGCEPSYKNYKYFTSKPFDSKGGVKLEVFNEPFLDTETETKFDFVTSIYVFPHFLFDEMENVAERIYAMLDKRGKFILVVANEKYLSKKLNAKKDLFLEKSEVEYRGKKYTEVLHYSEIPQIGTVIDYNREEKFYVDLFTQNGFSLDEKKDLDDNGFVCTVFVFSKK